MTKFKSLDLGADDYLVKPFGMMEMVSRQRLFCGAANKRECQNHFKRQPHGQPDRAHRTCGRFRVELTLKEFELLRLFLENPGRAFTRDQILSDIWGIDYDGETRTIDVHVRTLRKKLGKASKAIETVRGVGYRLEAYP